MMGGRIEDNEVVVDQALVYMGGKWQPYLVSWGFVDDPQRKGEVAIFGGAIPDPYNYDEFVKAK